jgi:hypothetical protein
VRAGDVRTAYGAVRIIHKLNVEILDIQLLNANLLGKARKETDIFASFRLFGSGITWNFTQPRRFEMEFRKMAFAPTLLLSFTCIASPPNETDQYMNDVEPFRTVTRPITGPMLSLPMVGNKRVLLVVGQWNNASNLTADEIREQVFSEAPRSLQSFVKAASVGHLNLVEFRTLAPDFGEKPAGNCGNSDMYERADKAIQTAGIKETDYDQLFVVVNCQGGANAGVPGTKAIFFGKGSTSHSFLHEFGHNLGVHHPRTYLNCRQEGDVLYAPEDCTVSANITDSGDPVGGGTGLYPAVTRAFTGWLGQREAAEITKTGLYRLVPLGNDGPQLYSIRRPGTNTYITVEFRQPNPPYDFPEQDNRNKGLWIRYSTVTSAVSSLQLNADPSDASLNSPTLLPGKALQDKTAGVSLRTCSAGPAGAIFAVAVANESLPDCTAAVAAPVINIPASLSEVSKVPVIAGSGVPGATLTVVKSYDPARVLARTTVDAQGQWRALINEPLPSGKYSFSARQTVGTRTSAWGNNHSLVIGEWVLGALVVNPVADKLSQTPVVSGEGTPGAVVQVVKSHNPAARLGQGTVDEYGRWAVRLDRMAIGSHSIAARQVLGGVTSGWSANYKIEVVQVERPIIESAVSEAVSEATVSGTATPGSAVIVVVANNPQNMLGHSIADISGRWRLDLDALPSGRLSISAKAYDNRNTSAWSSNKTFEVK